MKIQLDLNQQSQFNHFSQVFHSLPVSSCLPHQFLDFSKTILIDNVPIVDPDRAVRLKKLMLKIYSAISTDISENDLYFPFDSATNMTPGYFLLSISSPHSSFRFAFLTFKTIEDAVNAVKLTNNHVLDKKHTFKVCLYSELESIDAVPDEFVPPTPPPFIPRPSPMAWLSDPQCRDQFMIRHSHETEINWATPVQGTEPTIVYDGHREKSAGKSWCESYSQWSPQGTYLATFHPPGIKLWGGDQFEAHGRYLHTGVDMVDFSPCEKYMVTYVLNSSLDNPEAIIVWDVRNGEKLRTFSLKNALDVNFMVQAEIIEEKVNKKNPEEESKKIPRMIRGRIVSVDEYLGVCVIAEGNITHSNVPMNKVIALQEPNRLKWSADGQYLARLGVGIIQIYSAPLMQLLDKKSLAAKDLLDFAWSPKGNMLSYWSPAFGNLPAMMNIVEIPSRNTICSRKAFDVHDGKMNWQDDGEYLCIRMTKTAGKKKLYILMLFRVSDPEVPVELIELTEPILEIQWEPSGMRFCVVHGEVRSPTVSFYTMGQIQQPMKKKGVVAPPAVREVTLLTSLPNKQCNQVIWSPAGGIVVLAYVQSDSALFDFYDVDNNLTLASRKHDRCNRLVWDPSGRLLATATIIPLRQTAVRGIPDDGYNLYTFQGTKICEVLAPCSLSLLTFSFSQVRKERLYQFVWRPRPKNILSSEEIKEMVKNMKKYEKNFDKEDKEKRQQLNSAVLEERRRLASAYLSRVAERRAVYNETHAQRVALRDGYDSDDDSNYTVVIKVPPLDLHSLRNKTYLDTLSLFSSADGRGCCKLQGTNYSLRTALLFGASLLCLLMTWILTNSSIKSYCMISLLLSIVSQFINYTARSSNIWATA
jgi:translation initiation factor 3 subunit B